MLYKSTGQIPIKANWDQYYVRPKLWQYFAKQLLSLTIVKTRQTDWWHHLLPISCKAQGIRLGGGGYYIGGGWMQNFTTMIFCVTLVTLTKYFRDQQSGFYLTTKCLLIGNVIGASFTN